MDSTAKMGFKSDTAPLPLGGVRVMEFSHMVMGPSCGLILADLGADVIKIEPSPDGDPTRKLKDVAISFFHTFNRNKRSLIVDIKTDEGKALIHKLAAESDVLIENYGPGTMERLGCGYEDLSKINPRLVYCALKGYLPGPYEHRQALDEVVQFMGGLAYMTGTPGSPKRAGGSINDIMGGMFGVIAIQAALRERDRTGKGQYVISSLFENTAFLMGQHMARYQITGVAPGPMQSGNLRASPWTVYEPFRTRDEKMLFLGLVSDTHWKKFCERFGRSDLANDPRYQTNADRVRERPTIVPIVADIIADHTLDDMVAKLDHLGCPFAPVATPADLVDDPQLNFDNRMVEVDTPDAANKKTKIPRLPFEMSNHSIGLRTQPPAAGAHTADILADLGYARPQIDELKAKKIVR
jgi:crotonobetainyl-CoA:carnitine CoA-transferase CaiB-like acyl-CoA transferase